MQPRRVDLEVGRTDLCRSLAPEACTDARVSAEHASTDMSRASLLQARDQRVHPGHTVSSLSASGGASCRCFSRCGSRQIEERPGPARSRAQRPRPCSLPLPEAHYDQDQVRGAFETARLRSNRATPGNKLPLATSCTGRMLEGADCANLPRECNEKDRDLKASWANVHQAVR